MNAIGVIGVFLALILVIFLAYRKVNSFITAFAGAIVIIVTNGMNFWDSIIAFMKGGMDFVTSYGFLFIIGGIYGIILDKTNCAKSLAFGILKRVGKKRGILAAMIAVTVLAFAGLNAFIIIFTVYPILLYMFSAANISKNYITAIVLWGASVAQQVMPTIKPNDFVVIGQGYLGNSMYPAQILAVIATLICYVATYLYFQWAVKRDQSKGIAFVASAGEDVPDMDTMFANETIPSFASACVGIIVMIAACVVFNLDSVRNALFAGNGVFSVLSAIVLAGIIQTIQFRQIIIKEKGYSVKKILEEGFTGVLNALFATAGFIAFASVIQLSVAFGVFEEWMTHISELFNGYVGASLSVIFCSGICVSSLGGLLVFLGSLSAPFLNMGLNPDALLRVLMVSACGLDTLPWCACVAVYNDVAGIELKGTYKHTWWTCCFIPIVLGLLLAFIAPLIYK